MKDTARSLLILILGVGLGIGIFAGIKNLPTKIPGLTTNKLIPQTNQVVPSTTIVREKSDIIDVVKKVGPSVVSIAIKRPQTSTRNPFGLNPFFAPPSQQAPNTNREAGIGTGFIVDSKGIIVTNRHVVDTQGQYVVITNDNKKYDVQRVNIDTGNDFAILKIDANNLPAATLGDSNALEAGQSVIAMGNALGEFKNTVTSGIVSGLNRSIEAGDQLGGNVETLQNLIQTDAAINPGNSGGPLLNIGGQLIGINTAVASGQAQNIGFAIPINSIKPTINEFLATGKISRPFLGVQYQMITKRQSIISEVPEGAYIEDVVSAGPAEKAGLRAEDIITEINGKKINENNPLTDVIRTFKVGDTVEVKYNRNNNDQTTRVTIGEGGQQ
jgi:serine protease Do